MSLNSACAQNEHTRSKEFLSAESNGELILRQQTFKNRINSRLRVVSILLFLFDACVVTEKWFCIKFHQRRITAIPLTERQGYFS
jgi:hypothetical protein